MLKFFIACLLSGSSLAIQAQSTSLPSWFTDALNNKRLDTLYTFTSSSKLTPLQADFNGDDTRDIAVFVKETKTGKSGILLMEGKTLAYRVFGAGRAVAPGDDDFVWADRWRVYRSKTARETRFDPKSGDILGSNIVNLNKPGILIEDMEDGAAIAGGIIYWDGKKYKWIHQGE
ncbi:hypothetical protein [Paraflavitalea sp. CAU 1676]|uniref:hypothetical protein n=1 Tax=Paraflavitalea sp. CAU 1676 TaxID=3032598 RepID=UPI0023DC6F55|nr:hypothetical protein [Paraflavitalea sp. CAU 1676]MDF2187997.1 hypothetical protein [Paraflavitalea sp. CAU 1676]